MTSDTYHKKLATNYHETTIDGYNITNKYVPETTSVSVNKVWDDDNDRDKVRPTKIQYNLYHEIKKKII